MTRLSVLLFGAIGLVLAGFAAPSGAAAQELDRYQARLSPADHYNSNGQRLREAAQIIRQDRANVHRFGKRDPEDQLDSFFASKANRARMEAMLRNGSADPGVRSAIVNGTPLIEVIIYQNAVQVILIAP